MLELQENVRPTVFPCLSRFQETVCLLFSRGLVLLLPPKPGWSFSLNLVPSFRVETDLFNKPKKTFFSPPYCVIVVFACLQNNNTFRILSLLHTHSCTHALTHSCTHTHSFSHLTHLLSIFLTGSRTHKTRFNIQLNAMISLCQGFFLLLKQYFKPKLNYFWSHCF